jgi:hypothetical protein
MNSRSLILIGLTTLFLTSVPGCKKDDPPAPDRAAAAASAAQNRGSAQAPASQATKLDPQTVKNFRLDVCYFGTLTLKQARDSYFASLGKDEPSEKKVPTFGFPIKTGTTPPGGTAKPSGTQAAATGSAAAGSKPAQPAPAAASAILPFAGDPHAIPPPASAGKASPMPLAERRAFEFNSRAPYERSARGCNAAVQLKEPQLGELEAVLGTYTSFAMALAKDITAASAYYIAEGYKEDKFAKGKDLHKKLVEGFQKLDEQHEKLGSAIAAWRKDHPSDLTKQEEGEKLALAAVEDAKDALMALIPKKSESFDAKADKLDKSIASLKEFSSSHATDPWSKIMIGPFDVFLRSIKEAKSTPTGIEPESYLAVINSLTTVLESRNRAASRALVVKHKAANPRVPSSALPPGHPMPSNE